MQRRGRPSTQPPKLRDGFYIELKTHGSNSAIKIIDPAIKIIRLK